MNINGSFHCDFLDIKPARLHPKVTLKTSSNHRNDITSCHHVSEEHSDYDISQNKAPQGNFTGAGDFEIDQSGTRRLRTCPSKHAKTDDVRVLDYVMSQRTLLFDDTPKLSHETSFNVNAAKSFVSRLRLNDPVLYEDVRQQRQYMSDSNAVGIYPHLATAVMKDALSPRSILSEVLLRKAKLRKNNPQSGCSLPAGSFATKADLDIKLSQKKETSEPREPRWRHTGNKWNVPKSRNERDQRIIYSTKEASKIRFSESDGVVKHDTKTETNKESQRISETVIYLNKQSLATDNLYKTESGYSTVIDREEVISANCNKNKTDASEIPKDGNTVLQEATLLAKEQESQNISTVKTRQNFPHKTMRVRDMNEKLDSTQWKKPVKNLVTNYSSKRRRSPVKKAWKSPSGRITNESSSIRNSSSARKNRKSSSLGKLSSIQRSLSVTSLPRKFSSPTSYSSTRKSSTSKLVSYRKTSRKGKHQQPVKFSRQRNSGVNSSRSRSTGVNSSLLRSVRVKSSRSQNTGVNSSRLRRPSVGINSSRPRNAEVKPVLQSDRKLKRTNSHIKPDLTSDEQQSTTNKSKRKNNASENGCLKEMHEATEKDVQSENRSSPTINEQKETEEWTEDDKNSNDCYMKRSGLKTLLKAGNSSVKKSSRKSQSKIDLSKQISGQPSQVKFMYKNSVNMNKLKQITNYEELQRRKREKENKTMNCAGDMKKKISHTKIQLLSSPIHLTVYKHKKVDHHPYCTSSQKSTIKDSLKNGNQQKNKVKSVDYYKQNIEANQIQENFETQKFEGYEIGDNFASSNMLEPENIDDDTLDEEMIKLMAKDLHQMDSMESKHLMARYPTLVSRWIREFDKRYPADPYSVESKTIFNNNRMYDRYDYYRGKGPLVMNVRNREKSV